MGLGSVLGPPVFGLRSEWQAGLGGIPISERHRPLLADVVQSQVEQLQQRLIAGE